MIPFKSNYLQHFLIVASYLLIVICGIALFKTYWGDPSIYIVYAKNIANLDFFSFNPNQFSSGSTSPLWALLIAIPYWSGGIQGVKLFAIIITLLAVYFMNKCLTVLIKDNCYNGFVLLFVTSMLSIYGLMLYESSLLIIILSLLLLQNGDIFRKLHNGHNFSFGDWFHLIVIWSAIPLIRPDSTIILIINVMVMLFLFYKKQKTSLIFMVMISLLISLLPSVMYFGYSYLELGAFSVSSKCRSFSLKESADNFYGLYYSSKVIKYILLLSPALLLCYLGLKKMKKELEYEWVSFVVFFTIIAYILTLSFISPVMSDRERYLLPIIPFIGVGMSFGLKLYFKNQFIPIFNIAVIFLCFKPLYSSYIYLGSHFSFETIMEKDACDFVNNLSCNSVLTYEVQSRYYLDKRISLLSLDGIIDGKVAPYLENGDMTAFIKEYKPQIWIANDAVLNRKYLANSILNKVYKLVEEDQLLEDIELEGVKFKVLRRNQADITLNFLKWKYIIALQYSTN